MTDEPRTEAGLLLHEQYGGVGQIRRAIPRIEAEAATAARAEAFAEIRRGVEGLDTWPGVVNQWPFRPDRPFHKAENIVAVSLDAVLALLPSVPPESGTI